MTPRLRRILVSAVGGDLAQSVVKCLRDDGRPVRLIGCDLNRFAAGRMAVDAFRVAPPVTEPGPYLDFLRRVQAEEKIDYFFPLSEAEIQFCNQHRAALEALPARTVMQSDWIIRTFGDKLATVEFLRRNGWPHPATWRPEELSSSPVFPLVLKRRTGSGGQGLVVVRDRRELDFHLSRRPDWVIQEWLEGEEYTAGLFRAGATSRVIVFARTLAPGGYSQQVEPVWDDPMLLELPERLASGLEFSGSLNVQFRATRRGCIPFEINPRFSSTVYFRHLFGFRDVCWTLDLLEGRATSYLPPRRRAVGVRTLGEVLIDHDD